MNNINVGDLVYVIGPKENSERSFDGRHVWWLDDMDQFIGKIFKVEVKERWSWSEIADVLVLNCYGNYYFTYSWVIKIND